VKPFTYTYQGQTHSAFADHYLVDGYKRYLIACNDGNFVIAPSGIPGAGGTIVWVQENQPGETLHSHELIQALGEGLHDAEHV